MRLVILLVFLFSAGCATSQKHPQDKPGWKAVVLNGYTLTADSTQGRLQVDTVKGKGTVYIFERTVGRIEVDAGYMERIWLHVDRNKQHLKIPSEGAGFYEKICRCQFAGFHTILEGDLSWNNSMNVVLINGYVQLKDQKLTW